MNTWSPFFLVAAASLFFCAPAWSHAKSDMKVDVHFSDNVLDVEGKCDRDVSILLFSSGEKERPVYSSGAPCRNDSFRFSDNLAAWKLDEGMLTVVVNGEPTSKRLEFRKGEEGQSAARTKEGAGTNRSSSVGSDELDSHERRLGAIEAFFASAGITIPSLQKAASDIPEEASRVIGADRLKEMFSGGGLTAEGSSLFPETITFKKPIVLNRDAAGFAVIKKGAKSVSIVFDTPYEKRPIVNVTLSGILSVSLEGSDPETLADFHEVEEKFSREYFSGNVRYLIVDRSERGFTLLLNTEAPEDIEFAWSATLVEEARVSRSEDPSKTLSNESSEKNSRTPSSSDADLQSTER